jgi:hypothetical protein
MGEKRNLCRDLLGKPEGKRPLENPSFTGGNNIKMVLKDIAMDGVNWI